ncbi:MAG: 5-formyltetrahydrofolate cyclo-ligase, partial [Clostridia bacterium]|nr:5-formyltetrahydrofolate cyclo-ligase [Clostridia bacterium]
GYRIGYGKGFYDRYLSSFNGAKMGVEYSSCVVDELPRGRFDTAVDFLVTEKGVITINAK